MGRFKPVCKVNVYREKLSKVTGVINKAILDSALPIITATIISAVVFIPLFFVNRGIDAKLWLEPYRDFAFSLFLMLVWSAVSSFTIFPVLLIKVAGALVKTDSIKKINGRNKSFTKTLKGDLKELDHFLARILSRYFKSFNFGFLNHNQKRISRITRYGILTSLGLFAVVSFYFMYRYYTSDYHEIDLVNREDRQEFYYQFNPGFTNEYRVNQTKSIVQGLLKTTSIGSSAGDDKIDDRPSLITTLDGDRITFHTIAPEKSGLKSLTLKGLKRGGPLSFFNLKQKKANKSSAFLELFENNKRNDGFFYQQGKSSIYGLSSLKILIYGDDISKLNRLTNTCARKISKVPYVKQIIKGYREGTAEISIVPDISKLFFYNLNYDEVGLFLRYMFYQPVIFKHYRGNSLVDVRAGFNLSGINRFNDAVRYISGIEVPVDSGKKSIRIMDFASIKRDNVSSEISRKNGKPYISLDIRYLTEKKESVFNKVKSIMDEQNYSLGEYYNFDEDSVNKAKTKTVLFLSSVIAVFLIWFFLTLFFNSFTRPLFLLSVLPFIFIGVGAFNALTGGVRSIPLELSIVVSMIFSIYAGIIFIGGFFKRKSGDNASSMNANGVAFDFIFILAKAMAINFVIFALFLAPLLIMPGTGYFLKLMSGSILASLIFILMFFLAILPIICIMLIHSCRL